MKTVLVTGAAGFVGANVVRGLVAAGHTVHALVRGDDAWRLRGTERDVERHRGSVLDAPALAELLARVKPDWIFHLAAYGAYSTQSAPQAIFETNLIGTKNLLEAALGAGFEAFVNTGSSSEYGLCDHPPAESELPLPNSAYAYGKAAATLYCSFRASELDAKIATLRLYSVYGPFEEPTRFVPRLVVAGLRAEYPPLVSPSVARDFVYADDVARAFELVARAPHAPGAVYNVGTGVQTTIGQAVEAAREAFGIERAPRWGTMADRAWDTSVWVANIGKIGTEIGWGPTVDFRNGIEKTAAWLREEPRMLSFYSADREPPR